MISIFKVKKMYLEISKSNVEHTEYFNKSILDSLGLDMNYTNPDVFSDILGKYYTDINDTIIIDYNILNNDDYIYMYINDDKLNSLYEDTVRENEYSDKNLHGVIISNTIPDVIKDDKNFNISIEIIDIYNQTFTISYKSVDTNAIDYYFSYDEEAPNDMVKTVKESYGLNGVKIGDYNTYRILKDAFDTYMKQDRFKNLERRLSDYNDERKEDVFKILTEELLSELQNGKRLVKTNIIEFIHSECIKRIK